MRIGDRLPLEVWYCDLEDSGFNRRLITVRAEVVYIHPQHRFYTAQISLPNGCRYLESFTLR